MAKMESFNAPVSAPNNDVRIEPTITRSERPIDAVYPWEQTKPVQRAELDALYNTIVDLESRITVLKEMMQLVVSEITPCDTTPFDTPCRWDNLRRKRSSRVVCGSACERGLFG
jgi:hypothetical protein